MSIEKYSYYEFLITVIKGEYSYVIIDDKKIQCFSNEWYETQEEARFAAIGHIDLLENGEG